MAATAAASAAAAAAAAARAAAAPVHEGQTSTFDYDVNVCNNVRAILTSGASLGSLEDCPIATANRMRRAWGDCLTWEDEDVQLMQADTEAGLLSLQAAWDAIKASAPNSKFYTKNLYTYGFDKNFTSVPVDYWPMDNTVLSETIQNSTEYREYIKLYSIGTREHLKPDYPLFSPKRILVMEGTMRVLWCTAISTDLPAAVPFYKASGVPPTDAEWGAIVHAVVVERDGTELVLSEGKILVH